MGDKERLTTAQWVFERTLGWIAAAEIKVGVIVTIDTAMLAGLATAISAASAMTAWATLLAVAAAVCLGVAIGCAAAAVMPRLVGPKKSLLYFGRIVDLSSADYSETFRKATDEQLLTDWTEQIHRNAEIAKIKHSWVRKAMGWSFFSAMPWIAAISLLVKK